VDSKERRKKTKTLVVLSFLMWLILCYTAVCYCISVLSSFFIFTARCTLVQSAVLRSHVVCLSVCDVGGLWSHRLDFFRNNFTIS